MNIDRDQPAKTSTAERLTALFGGYKAEWLGEHLFELFTEPSYFPELKHAQPCVLMGGRGTGKTTILKCLSYEGQFALSGHNPESTSTWPYYGFYYRVNTNRVAAFKGPEMSEEEWVRFFSHYVNLELCDLVLQFLSWYQVHNPGSEQLSAPACRAIALSLNVDEAETVRQLSDKVVDARLRFEALINNIGDQRSGVQLSLLGAPLDRLFEALRQLSPFSQRLFFFLVDEYENFADYQQEVVNTLIKHSAELYTFKVGVRELGFKRRTTLSSAEQLVSPSDYVRIHIVEALENQFDDFAAAVCNGRLRRINANATAASTDIRELFPELSETEEAELLGVRERVREINNRHRSELPASTALLYQALDPLMAYFLNFWAEGHSLPLSDIIEDYREASADWERRLDNYRYALLFTIKRGRRGIRKYFAGWRVYTKLAAGNIRYLLELVDYALHAHLAQENDLLTPIAVEIQTNAAKDVGKKNLSELEGLSIHGARLTKLVLSLGRVFQVMASHPEGHTPEANQFTLAENEESVFDQDAAEADALLQGAIMHLALVRFSGSKLQDESDIRSYDYMVHPVFAPFFEFSYRRKRKIALTASELLALVRYPNRGIATVLSQQNRSAHQPLPEQLKLFEGFYAGGA